MVVAFIPTSFWFLWIGEDFSAPNVIMAITQEPVCMDPDLKIIKGTVTAPDSLLVHCDKLSNEYAFLSPKSPLQVHNMFQAGFTYVLHVKLVDVSSSSCTSIGCDYIPVLYPTDYYLASYEPWVERYPFLGIIYLLVLMAYTAIAGLYLLLVGLLWLWKKCFPIKSQDNQP